MIFIKYQSVSLRLLLLQFLVTLAFFSFPNFNINFSFHLHLSSNIFMLPQFSMSPHTLKFSQFSFSAFDHFHLQTIELVFTLLLPYYSCCSNINHCFLLTDISMVLSSMHEHRSANEANHHNYVDNHKHWDIHFMTAFNDAHYKINAVTIIIISFDLIIFCPFCSLLYTNAINPQLV